MAAGAEFWVTYYVTDSNGGTYTPYSNDFSSALSNAETAVFDDSSVVFYNDRDEEVWFTSFPNPYKYNGEYYPIDAIHCDGSDAQGGTFNVSGGCQIIVYYGKDPETGGSDVGGPNQGGNTPGSGSGGGTNPGGDSGDVPLDGEYAVDSNGNLLKTTLNPFNIVIHYKDLEGNTVLEDTKYNNVFWVRRFDEASYINLEIATSKEETADGTRYLITGRPQIQNTIANPPLILQRFDGLISNSGGVLYYEGKDEPYGIHEATAYYEVNSFDISIFINDSSRGKVVSTSNTNKEYPSGSTINDVYKNYTLKLTAVPIEPYKFDYWEVNGQKTYTSTSDLTYVVTSDTTVKCYFEEPIILEDDKIATNDDIHTVIENSSLYPINADENSKYLSYRCPTKYDILNNNYDLSAGLTTNAGQLINISGNYIDDQCVKFEDISFNPRTIKIRLYNDLTRGVNKLGDTEVTFYASENTLDSISAGDIELTSINIEDYGDQTDGDFNKGDAINIKYTLPNYNIFDKHIKIKIHGSYGAKRGFRAYCKNSSTTSWMNQSDIPLPIGTHDTVQGYARKYNYFIKINGDVDTNLCVVFYA